jgi:hypothetical protein
MLVSSAILFVNFTVPKKMFKTMNECYSFKTVIEKRIAATYNPVNLFQRAPKLSCVAKPVKQKAKSLKPKHINTKIVKSKSVKPVFYKYEPIKRKK